MFEQFEQVPGFFLDSYSLLVLNYMFSLQLLNVEKAFLSNSLSLCRVFWVHLFLHLSHSNVFRNSLFYVHVQNNCKPAELQFKSLQSSSRLQGLCRVSGSALSRRSSWTRDSEPRFPESQPTVSAAIAGDRSAGRETIKSHITDKYPAASAQHRTENNGSSNANKSTFAYKSLVN